MNQEVVVSLMRKLVIRNVPRLPNQSEEQYETKVNTLLRYLLNILGSKMTPTHVQINDQMLISELVKKKLSRENRIQEAIRFSELYGRLSQLQIIAKRWSLVYLLYTIGNDKSSYFDDGSLSLSALHIREFSLRNQLPIEPPKPQPRRQEHQNELEQNQLHLAYQSYKTYENTTFEVDESELLRDVIFAFQGIDGNYVRYDSLIDAFIIDSKVGVPKSTRNLVRKLCELGWLFKKLKSFVDTNLIQSTNGLVVQSFCAAIESELTSYYKLIAILENQTQTKSSVTLRQLLVWTLEPTEKLKMMSTLVDSCRSQKGGLLLGTIHSFTRHGDPFIETFVKGILAKVCVPFFNMVKSWVFEGELEDPYQEFFVGSNAEVSIEHMWFKKYYLEQDMIPSFITPEFGSKILKIGKTINFIRQCCNDSEWIINSNTLSVASQSFSYDTMLQLEVVINKIATIANRRVMELIFRKYKLSLHCAALRKYMLLGQGDFIQHLLDLLQSDLDKPSHTVYRHNLLAVLESAIRGSNAQYDDKDVLDRLDVRMMSKTSSTGWDIFCLDYRITLPLNTIFTQETMLTYTKVFQFLWTIKRVESSLNSTWKRHMHLSKVLNRAIRLIPKSNSLITLASIMHTCNIVRHNMVLFIGNIQYYLMFEVLEIRWQELSQAMDKLKTDGDLDQLIQAHHRYLVDIIDQALLSKNQKDLKNQLEKVLHFVVEYIRTQDLVAMSADEIIQKHLYHHEKLLMQSENQMDDDEFAIHNPSSDSDVYDESSDHVQLRQCYHKVQEIKKQYEEQSYLFLQMLEKPQSNDVLEYLRNRLQSSAEYVQER